MPRRSGRRTAFPRINIEVVRFAFDHLAERRDSSGIFGVWLRYFMVK
jgi:hypothetical protein